MARTGATLVPPYDDPRTMAGQGTIAVEILQQLETEPDLVIVPVGGGGCIAGITTYLAERTANTAVLGIEPAGAAAMMAAWPPASGHPRPRRPVRRRRRGEPSRNTTYLALSAAGDMVSVTTVDEGAVCTAMLDLYQNEGIIAEPAGALAVAGLMETEVAPGATVVCLISGGNNDVSRYGEVLERSLVHLGLKHYFLVDFPQEPGALRRFLDEVLGPGDDITLFEVRQAQQPGDREALVGVELSSAADLDGLRARMAASGLRGGAGAGFTGLPPPHLGPGWYAARRPNGRPAGWCRSRRRSRPSRAPARRRGHVDVLGAQVAGDRDRAAPHDDPALLLVVVDGEVCQPRVGHRGLAVPQRDQVAVEAEHAGVLGVGDLGPIQLGAQEGLRVLRVGDLRGVPAVVGELRLASIGGCPGQLGSGCELKNWKGRDDAPPHP